MFRITLSVMESLVTSQLGKSPTTWTTDDRRNTRRTAIAGSVGTLIEYYDFSSYGYMAVIMAPLFFPDSTPIVALLSSLAVFGTAYAVRPLGGIVFGHIGDRHGRRTALTSVLICMGVASTTMGLLPTHAEVGVWATVFLVMIRMVQGFSAGGENGGAATLISEAAPRHMKTTYGAFVPLGSTGGFALAAAVAGTISALTTDEQMASWGWRIPFLLALPLTLVCYWLRTRINETQDNKTAKATRLPIGALLREQPGSLVTATAIAAATNGTAYVGLSYLSIHLSQRLGYPATASYWVATLAIGLSAILMPLGGRLGDRIGVVNLALIGFVGYTILTYPAMAAMDISLSVAAIAYVIIMLNTVGAQVGAYTVLPQLFDKKYRYTGASMGWNLGVVAAGGTAPFISVWLVEQTGNLLAPAFFVITLAVVGIIAMTASRRLVAEHLAGAE